MKRILPFVAVALLVAGCASANKTNLSASNASDHTNKSGVASSSSATPGMTMKSGGSGATATVDKGGVPTPVPIRTIAAGTWGQMAIQAETMTPLSFYVYTGSGYREVKSTPKDSFHLMVMLTDKDTHVAIPYANVWATITDAKGKVVYDQPQWPMLSEYMGPHYGDDVALPGPGTYHLSVLVSAPVAALHIEYKNMWQGKHRVNSTFTWPGK